MSSSPIVNRWSTPGGHVVTPPVGAIVDGLYRVEGELGRGGMGVVLLATDIQLERPVALKLIHPSAVTDEDARRRFRDEARAMAAIRHENVVQVYRYGEVSDVPYFAMEHVPGATLSEWIIDRAVQGPAPIDEIVGIAEQLCRGVAAIHAGGIIHGDVKPSNVLLGSSFRAAVTDFGLVRMLGAPESGAVVVGTPAYIAPESVVAPDPCAPLTPAADVYALGVVLYEMLTGRLPFQIDRPQELFDVHFKGEIAPPPSRFREDLQPAFDAVMAKVLARDPKSRYRDANELRRALLGARENIGRKALPRRLVVVDDDEDFRAVAEAALQFAFPEAEVVAFAEGREALDAIDRDPPELAVVDLDMPRLNGIELTAALRASEHTSKVRVVVVSASGGGPDWQLLSSIGADGFLVKPLDALALVSLVRRVLATG